MGQNQAFFKLFNSFKSNKRSHSGDDGVGTLFPYRASKALPCRGSRRETAEEVVGKKRLRGRVRQFIGQRISAVRAERDEQTQKEKRLRCPSRHELNDVDEKANCQISVKKRPFSVENGRFSYIFKVFHLAHFVLYCLVFIKFLVNFQVKNTEISSVLFAFTQLVKTVRKRQKYTFIFKN